MYRSYFYGLLVVGAVVAGVLALISGDQSTVTVLSARMPEPVGNIVQDSTTIPTVPPSTVTTIRMVEPDDGTNWRPTTTTTLPLATTAAPTTTQAPAQPAATQPKKQAPPPPAAGGFNAGSESEFASAINVFRSSNGLAGLSRDGSLDAEARAWAKAMADQGGLSHSNIGRFLPPWSAVAENVGSGGTVSSLFGALTNSSGHRSNMLGGYTHFGIGVWVDGSGTLWTCHVFAG